MAKKQNWQQALEKGQVAITEGPIEMTPLEAAVDGPEEVLVPSAAEAPVVMPKEAPAKKICGINGCTTWYEDPAVMKKHLERQHGIGVQNLNRPKPRNANIRLA